MAVQRTSSVARVEAALGRAPVTALLGPRQCGKTTLARQVAEGRRSQFFDLESASDARRLENPELVLSSRDALIVLDEIQARPNLFNALRVLVDRPGRTPRFLVLGSASPALVRGVSESLAGRAGFIQQKKVDPRRGPRGHGIGE